jgi:ATP/maltotriose-dependent transcriptional regulator MalT
LLAHQEVKYARLNLTSRGIEESWLTSDIAHRPANDFEHLAMAWVLIAEDRPEAALRLIDPLAARLKRHCRMRRFAQVRGVAAIAAFRAGNGLAALAAISDAVKLSMPGAALRALIEEGPALQEVIGFARRQIPLWRNSAEPIGLFIATLCPASIITTPSPNRTSDLSPRETEIARLLGDGLANREISARLEMAPEKHLRQVGGR